MGGGANVKGSIIAGVIDDLAALRHAGRLADDQLECALEPGDIELLHTKPNPASWYPMASYTRLLELLYTIDGGGLDRETFFDQRGRKNAERLMDAGMYQQLAFVDRWAQEAGKGESPGVAEFQRNMKLAMTLASSIYSVGKWDSVSDPDHADRLMVTVDEASDYSEPMCWAVIGFLNQCAKPRDRERADLFRGHRPSADRFEIHMTMDVGELH